VIINLILKNTIMKRGFILICTILLFFTTRLNAGSCSCGTHETGIYEYMIHESEGCCSGTPIGPPVMGTITTYKFDTESGIWIVADRSFKPCSEVQELCCPRT